MKLNIVPLVLAAVIFSACSRTTYYVVRHAEKETANGTAMMSGDPQLSEAGKVRAIVLRDQLAGKHITHIFSTNTIRTTSTAKPLSDQTGVNIQLYNTRDSLDYFINSLKAIKKTSVLVVGHSNTVDDIVNKLCGEMKIPGDLPETEYDNLFIVKVNNKKATFTRKKYGYPSNPDK